jgi:hypothetical protein
MTPCFGMVRVYVPDIVIQIDTQNDYRNPCSFVPRAYTCSTLCISMLQDGSGSEFALGFPIHAPSPLLLLALASGSSLAIIHAAFYWHYSDKDNIAIIYNNVLLRCVCLPYIFYKKLAWKY